MPIVVRVVQESEGGWRVSVGRPDQCPTEARPDPAAVAALKRAWNQLQDFESTTMFPGQELERTRMEEEVGRALTAVLHADEALDAHVSRELRLAQAEDTRLVVAVGAADDTLGRLPWELFADAPDGDPIEGLDLGAVVRLAATPHHHTERGAPGIGLRILRWCPSPDVPACAERIAELDGLARQLSPIRCLDLPLRLEPSPDAEEGWVDVLHLILYGPDLTAQLDMLVRSYGLMEGESPQRSPLSRARLVVVDVCNGEHARQKLLEELGRRLVAAGASACLCPRRRVGGGAARSLSSGLYTALVNGKVPVEAVIEGRRGVRALQGNRPDSRWHNIVFTVGSTRVLEDGPLLHGNLWLPDGWPNPDGDAVGMLRRARELGNDHGYVGIEHLALAMDAFPSKGPASRRVRALVHMHRRELMERAEGLKLRFPRIDSDWTGTPRLRGYARMLMQGFSLEELWAVIIADDESPLHQFDAALGITEENEPALPEGWGEAAPTHLQVLGGPEDGRTLSLARPATVARWNQFGAQHADELLYMRTARYDASLSRSPMLGWGPDRVPTLQGPRDAGLIRWKMPSWVEDDVTDYGDSAPLVERVRPNTPARLRCGDILVLTPLTRLRAV
ncbi:MAG: hypothetical protein H6739_09705 [Alphaproteobacteria bacterium]|nr:hypothetical protein [Alphaproteobacteria bacterium]